MLFEHRVALAHTLAERVPGRSPIGRCAGADESIYGAEPGAGADAVSRVNVAVAVADDACSCIYEVAAACRALGFEHTATLATVGVLTGSMEFERLASLWAVPGVLAVEIECDLASRITARAESGCRVH
jgi:hypothetical protein